MINSQVMFDAIKNNAQFIPRSQSPPFAVAGYINGAITELQWDLATWDMFPQSFHVRINVTGDPARGNALDVENGDATPADVEPWIRTRNTMTAEPLLVYCNRSNAAACIAGRNAAFTATGRYAHIWEATLDGTIGGHSATQFTQLRDGQGNAVADVTLITNTKLIEAMVTVLRAVA